MPAFTADEQPAGPGGPGPTAAAVAGPAGLAVPPAAGAGGAGSGALAVPPAAGAGGAGSGALAVPPAAGAGGAGSGALAPMPFATLIGLEMVSVSTESVVARLPWAPERCTAGGMMHGGAIMALADTTGAVLAAGNLRDGTSTTTLSSATQFVRGLRGGAATATSRLLHRGRTTIVAETDVTDDDGRLRARVTQTQAVLDPT
jgi:1,4-dihydroxy-2-naphthoyl-CoA hydrolase